VSKSPSVVDVVISLHGFACASCTEPGSNTNPVVMTVAAAMTAAIKAIVFFIVTKKEYEGIDIIELGRILLLSSSRYI
jgi:hypothetical protein